MMKVLSRWYDYAPGLIGGQDVAQAQSDTETRSHADTGIHGVERRQDAASSIRCRSPRCSSNCAKPGRRNGGDSHAQFGACRRRHSARVRRQRKNPPDRVTFSSPKRYIAGLPSTSYPPHVWPRRDMVPFLYDHTSLDIPANWRIRCNGRG